MPPLSTDRDTKEIEGTFVVLPVAATTKIHAGSLVAVNAAGNATPGAVATTLRGVGRADEAVDNSAGAAGDVRVSIKKGVFFFKNSAAGDAITNADIGADCFIVDDETVAKTNGTNTRSIAGKVHLVDAVLGVAVKF